MSAIVNFSFEGLGVRGLERNGTPWFVGADVCRVLEVKNNRDAISRLDPEEKGVAFFDTLGGQQELVIISESGLYTLMFRCRESIKSGTRPYRFRKWVTSEVLPSIRKTGSYVGGVRRHTEAATPGKVRYAKLQLAWAVARLDALGVNVASIDMNAVVNFSRAVLR